MLIKKLIYAGILILFVTGCSKDNTQTITPPLLPGDKIVSVTDITYGQNTSFSGDNQKLLLDIYYPKNASVANTYPLLVMAHGGSFLTGNKSNMSSLCQTMAAKGYIAVSIDYRLGWDYGNAPSPSACKGDTLSLQKAVYRSLQDYNAALRFLVHNADKFFINTDWIFVGGSSAGAVAAMNTTYVTPAFANDFYKDEKAELGGLKNADNNLTDDFTIRGDVSLWGAVMSPELITPATAVPMVAFHGSADETIPITNGHYALCSNYPVLYGSQDIYQLLSAYAVPAVLHVAVNQGHDPDIYDNNTTFVSDNIHCFLQGLIGKTEQTGMYDNLTSSCQ